MTIAELKPFISLAVLLVICVCTGSQVTAQLPATGPQEVSDADGQPVLIKHLPNYEKVRASAVFGTEKSALDAAIKDQPVLNIPEFTGGTEFATANYPEGRLLIIEYTNPQSSIEADTKVQQYLASNPFQGTVYRRIGNYNAFVFGASDVNGAEALLDQVKYEKTVQWLGEDPYLLRKLERYMVSTSRDIMISTVLVIVLGLATSVLAGIGAGFIFFRFREQKRAHRTAFSDAGGLTRLNLDGLSE